MNKEVRSLRDIRQEHIVTQRFDYSCGSAALATLFDYYLGNSVEEKEIILCILNKGDRKKIAQRNGFSLLDLKLFVAGAGYQAEGFRLSLEELKKLEVPAIIPVNVNGYKHFVVFRGVKDGRIFLADPAMGNMVLKTDYFQKIWYAGNNLREEEGLAFVVNNKPGAENNNLLQVKDKDQTFLSIPQANSLFKRRIAYDIPVRGEF